MLFDTRKPLLRQILSLLMGLNTTKFYKYIEYIICDVLSDENDINSKERSLYDRSDNLLRKFYFCSKNVKNQLLDG